MYCLPLGRVIAVMPPFPYGPFANEMQFPESETVVLFSTKPVALALPHVRV